MTGQQTPFESVTAFVDAWRTGNVFTIESVHDEPDAVALVTFTSDGKLLLRRSHVRRVLDQIAFLDGRIDSLTRERDEVAEKLAVAMRTVAAIAGGPGDQNSSAPHQVTVTQLGGDFDLSDKREHEKLVADGATGGWVSHLVQHPPACHQLRYGQLCPFDDEWENGQYTYDDLSPGLYDVLPGHHDVGDHNGEYSHTEDYLVYTPIGDAPQRPAPAAAIWPGYSEEPPF